MIEWTLSDLANRLGSYACLAAASVLVAPLFAGDESLLLMVAVLILLSQAWRLALARQLHARLDANGVSKLLGHREWRVAWAEVTGARLITMLGSTQLVLTTGATQGWSISDRLAGRIPPDSRAVQVPAAQLAAVRQLLSERGLLVA
ncbi:MAG: hypothetical protein ACOH1Y_16095 [Propionicimonas sp.]